MPLNKAVYIIIAFVFVLMTSSCRTNKVLSANVKTDMNFVMSTDMDAIIKMAKDQNKLIFMDFYADWCLPCRIMDDEVFSDPEIQDYLDEHYISVKVEADKGEGYMLATRYLVEGYPTLLFLDDNGKELTRKLGAAFHRELYELSNEALSFKK
jgi:thiol:disulfide interchange protein